MAAPVNSPDDNVAISSATVVTTLLNSEVLLTVASGRTCVPLSTSCWQNRRKATAASTCWEVSLVPAPGPKRKGRTQEGPSLWIEGALAQRWCVQRNSLGTVVHHPGVFPRVTSAA